MEIIKVQAIRIDTLHTFEIELQVDEYVTYDGLMISAILPETTVSVKGDYYFTTFQKFRDSLLHLGIGLKCSGSLLNVCQSPMASYSEKIYIITLGMQAKSENLVSIFDYSNIDKFPNSIEQDEYYKKWLSSLKK